MSINHQTSFAFLQVLMGMTGPPFAMIECILVFGLCIYSFFGINSLFISINAFLYRFSIFPKMIETQKDKEQMISLCEFSFRLEDYQVYWIFLMG
jgi:hypothetical protein